MKPKELKDRTARFSMSIINLIDKLPNTIASRVIANQIARSELQSCVSG